MNKMMLIAALMMTGTLAHADGFECETVGQDLNIKIYNHTSPEDGTRNVSVMVVSDPSIQFGNKTIARFTAGNTLTSASTSYTAKVDLRYNDSGRGGENLVGTKLGQLKTLKVTVFHAYDRPVAHGAKVAANLNWEKRNGTVGGTQMVCRRYLKN